MSTLDILMAAAGLAATTPLVVSDVFATALYTGNSSTQTINNGIDLAGKGGMVWLKNRGAVGSHLLVDSVRGISNQLSSDTTGGQVNGGVVTGITSTGFSLGNTSYNGNANLYASWTFRKAPKFFDVVTYTGNGVAGRQIPHNLGVVPGMIIFKDCTNTFDWQVWHKDIGVSNRLQLNQNFAVDGNTILNGILPTSTNITLSGNGYGVNQTGANFVAYIFAHDPSADGIIRCGSFTTDASGNASINLGYRPQFVLFKLTSTSSNWVITDSARGMPTGTGDKVLVANLADSEITTSIIDTSSNGFSLTGLGSNVTGIYMAIKSAV